MNRGHMALVIIGGLGVLWACNDHDPHPANSTDPGNNVYPGGGGGGSSSGTPADAGLKEAGSLDAGECTDLADPTTRVDENNVSDDVPTALGGDISTINATYDLTSVQKYVGATGQAGLNGLSYREVIRITGTNVLERNRISQLNTGPEQPLNARYALQTTASSTNTLTLIGTCPTTGNPETFSYTLQNGKLTLTSATGESFTYTSRP